MMPGDWRKTGPDFFYNVSKYTYIYISDDEEYSWIIVDAILNSVFKMFIFNWEYTLVS